MEEEIDLREYVRTALRWWRLILGVALLAVVTALGVTLLRPTNYEATATVAGRKPAQPGDVPLSQLALSDDVLQGLLARLSPLPEGVATAAGLRGMLQARPGADAGEVQLTVRAREPQESLRIADAWAEQVVAVANEGYRSAADSRKKALLDQVQQEQVRLDEAEKALIQFQAESQLTTLEAQAASAEQDVRDYLTERRELERLIRRASELHSRLAGQAADAPASMVDAATAWLLQAEALASKASPAPVALKRDGGSPQASARAGQQGAVTDTSTQVKVHVAGVDAPTVVVPAAGGSSAIHLQVSDASLLSMGRTVGELASFVNQLTARLEAQQQDAAAQVTTRAPQAAAQRQRVQELQVQEDRLVRARDVVRGACFDLTGQAESLQIEGSGGVQATVVSRAAAGGSGNKFLNVAVAGVLGLMLGLFGAFAVEWWRGGAKTSAVAEQAAATQEGR